MSKFLISLRFKTRFLWLVVMCFMVAGCATQQITAVSDIEARAGAISVPYSISSSGRILIDVSVDDGPIRSLALDTGATISVLYKDFAETANLNVSEKTRFVRGLVGQGERPVIEDVTFHIGPQGFQMDQLIMLDTPLIKDEAIGLIGADLLALYVTLFNKETLTATFIPRQTIEPAAFRGWNRIPLETFTDADTNSRLYFANMDLNRRDIPVLIDTGSNFSFINWKLARMDTDVRRLERNLIRNGTLQGALDSTSLTRVTVFHDLQLGKQTWDKVGVVIMGLDALDTVAPVDEPMMVAGAKVFAPHTIAFDLGGRNLYVKPDTKR